MNLTREQAVAEHRKMWRWILEMIEKYKRCIDIGKYKIEYIYRNKYKKYPKNDCFLCEYDIEKAKFSPCSNCPVQFPNENSECLGGLYYKVCRAETWQEQAELARQIAELPEREDV